MAMTMVEVMEMNPRLNAFSSPSGSRPASSEHVVHRRGTSAGRSRVGHTNHVETDLVGPAGKFAPHRLVQVVQ